MNLYKTYIILKEDSQSYKTFIQNDIRHYKDVLSSLELIKKKMEEVSKYFSSQKKKIEITISKEYDEYKISINILDAKSVEEMEEHSKKIKKILSKFIDETMSMDLYGGLLKFRTTI